MLPFFKEHPMLLFAMFILALVLGILVLRLVIKNEVRRAKKATEQMSADSYTVRERAGKRFGHILVGGMLCLMGFAMGAFSFAYFPEFTYILAPSGLVFILLGALLLRMARTRIEVSGGDMLAVPMLGRPRIGRLGELTNFSTTKAFSTESLMISGKGMSQFVFDSTVPGYDLLKRDLVDAASGGLPGGSASPERVEQWRGKLRRERGKIAIGVVVAALLAAAMWLCAIGYNNANFAHIGSSFIPVTETALNGRDIFAGGKLVADGEQLQKLTAVTTLWADDEGITDLSGIEALSSLRMVELDDNPISDISPLYKLKSLTLVTLKDTDVSEAQIAALKGMNPGCIVVS